MLLDAFGTKTCKSGPVSLTICLSSCNNLRTSEWIFLFDVGEISACKLLLISDRDNESARFCARKCLGTESPGLLGNPRGGFPRHGVNIQRHESEHVPTEDHWQETTFMSQMSFKKVKGHCGDGARILTLCIHIVTC
jgi:hypothetical protein